MAAHLHRILIDYWEKRYNPSFPAVLISPSDSHTPVDYVHLSIDPAASPVPRPEYSLWDSWALSYVEDQQWTIPCPSSLPSTLSTLHKRGSRLDLANYWEVYCSNLFSGIFHLPGWTVFFCLTLLSISGSHRTPLYALCCDQTKGFDPPNQRVLSSILTAPFSWMSHIKLKQLLDLLTYFMWLASQNRVVLFLPLNPH